LPDYTPKERREKLTFIGSERQRKKKALRKKGKKSLHTHFLPHNLMGKEGKEGGQNALREP